MKNSFEKLKVWQKAHQLVLDIYKMTDKFPSEEKYGIISQIRRSAVSVATNITEGHKKKTDKDFINYLNISEGSLEETKYLLLLSKDLGYINDKEYLDFLQKMEETGKMLHGFQRKLRS